MSLDLQQVMNSPLAVRFLAFLARRLPPRLGYRIGDAIADWIATQRDAKITRAVRLNQQVIYGGKLEDSALDQIVRETLRNNAHDLYNLYHYLHQPAAMQQKIEISPPACDVVERPEFAARGLVILGLHLSNFDFVLRSIFQQGLQAVVLTLPDPQGGRRVEYEMRKQTGMNLVPASIGALRDAIRHLQRGGIVVTGLDHPIPHAKPQPIFFGRPASLPTHHVQLARKAGVPVVVMAAIQQDDGKYHVFRSDFIEMELDPDTEQETLRNAERVLKQAEHFIRLAPQQWNVPLPIWQDLPGTM